MKRLVVILLVVVLLAGAGGAAWWFLLRPAPEGETAEAAAPAVAARSYLTLEPLTMTVIRHDQVTQLVNLVLTVELADAEAVEFAEASRPRLRDALLAELHGLYALRYVEEQGFAAPAVRRRLLSAARRALGGDKVAGVSIQHFGTSTASGG